jgi:hypothetical protein
VRARPRRKTSEEMIRKMRLEFIMEEWKIRRV